MQHPQDTGSPRNRQLMTYHRRKNRTLLLTSLLLFAASCHGEFAKAPLSGHSPLSPEQSNMLQPADENSPLTIPFATPTGSAPLRPFVQVIFSHPMVALSPLGEAQVSKPGDSD